MATLESLKQALRRKVSTVPLSARQPLSDAQYRAGYDILVQNSGWAAYREFIALQLTDFLAHLLRSRSSISVLEIGPGPKSVLGYLPYRLRYKIGKYTALEPNELFAADLETWLGSSSKEEGPLPCLEGPPDIRRVPFALDDKIGRRDTKTQSYIATESYDAILFCHSLYGMNPPHAFIKRALDLLPERPQDGMVFVAHRAYNLELGYNLDLAHLVCHRSASLPTGYVSIADQDDTVDCFASFIAGFTVQDVNADVEVRTEWRKVCRALGRREINEPDHLLFSAPEFFAAFNKNATALPELTARVPLAREDMTIKNREARLRRPAAAVRPTEVKQVQECVQWALKHDVGLTIIGGGHSGHCLWPSVVSVDMSTFNRVHILPAGEDKKGDGGVGLHPLIVAEAGCKTGDIIQTAMEAGLTVPLGARPSVGAGLWLQGGIGHLARLHGLACDAIVGAVLVDVSSAQILIVGQVPEKHRPTGAVRPHDEADLLWALKGAGTNFGIITSIVFKAHPALNYSVQNWILPLKVDLEAQQRLRDFDELVASTLPRDYSADAYLYWNEDHLALGITVFTSSTTSSPTLALTAAAEILGPPHNVQVVDGVGLFETEMYMSGMHGGHGGGKTSAFKRCVFLEDLRDTRSNTILVAAIKTRPSPLCYLHLLHGGGAVGDVAPDATAFGCRNWSFACVITGVWPRDQDGTEIARAAVKWVYDVVGDLLPMSRGVYGADLGPDPRDATLAAQAFGPNRPRLGQLKQKFDPHHVLASACPLLRVPKTPTLVVLVTGESGVGKDYCAKVWASRLVDAYSEQGLTAVVASISESTKRAYAAATGADLNRLFQDRAYKEEHRLALTRFFSQQMRQRPRLKEEHFLDAIIHNKTVDVLFITGMREEAPVAAMSHLVPDIRLVEVHVQASDETRRGRRGYQGVDGINGDGMDWRTCTALHHSPDFIFDNNTVGSEVAKKFADDYICPFFDIDLQRLASLIRAVPNYPRRDINFQHVLGIAQQPGGLALCVSLLRSHFTGEWRTVDAVVCCEAGGFIYASALAIQVDTHLALIRDAGKLPPPTISVVKSASHISSNTPGNPRGKKIEMERDILPKEALVVVVDDVLATGKTLFAVLQLLREAGIAARNISVLVVAEFPIHRGRQLLVQNGFGEVNVRSLLVYGDA